MLAAMGCDRERAVSSLRFSIGRSNTAEEMDDIIRSVREIVVRLYAEGRAFVS